MSHSELRARDAVAEQAQGALVLRRTGEGKHTSNKDSESEVERFQDAARADIKIFHPRLKVRETCWRK